MGKAFEETVNRHGSFRTTFNWDEEKDKLIEEPNAYKKAYDMSVANNMNPNFSLDKLPLISVKYKLGGEAYALNTTVHHIVTDETSLGIFFYGLFQLYVHGIDSLPPVQLHYSDFSDWSIRTADRHAELHDEQIKYWSQKLQDVQPLVVTLTKPSEVEQSPITQIEGHIDSKALKENSFIVGTAITQRSVAQLQEVVGFFANMLPICTTIGDRMTFAEYLEIFHYGLVADLANNDTKSSSQGRSYFKHLFTSSGLNMCTINQLNISDINATSILSLPNGEEKYEFLLTVHHKTGEVILRFNNYLYTKETACQFLDAYLRLVNILGKNPHIKIGDISAISDDEVTHLIKELSTSGPVNPVKRKLHQLIEAQAAKTPTSIAVEYEDQYLTYAQLNSKANRLAHMLSQQGVGPDSVVTICFERGIPQILAILSILKAGGAFLPLDPKDPTLQKEMFIVDTNTKILLSTYSQRRDFDKALASKVIVVYIDNAMFKKRLVKFNDSNLEDRQIKLRGQRIELGEIEDVINKYKSIQCAADTSPDIGLPQSDVEVTHDLFSIGLNSLLTVQATAAIGESFRLNISLNGIYLRPTIRKLSNIIINAMGQDQQS
ncbi:hypothetical protein BDM02DRAFT_3252713, partial [Thelephora ganbajun]